LLPPCSRCFLLALDDISDATLTFGQVGRKPKHIEKSPRLVELTKDNYADSTRYSAATALLDRGYGRPAQSLDLHLSADAITKRLSDMTDAELAALEARMITIPAALALEHADEPQVDGDTDGSQSDTDAEQDTDGCADEVA
jgi:hypothetical protein